MGLFGNPNQSSHHLSQPIYSNSSDIVPNLRLQPKLAALDTLSSKEIEFNQSGVKQAGYDRASSAPRRPEGH